MNSKSNKCISCDNPLSSQDKYCPICGLETKYRNLSIKFLIKSFFEAFLNFDTKMFHSIRDVWIPNRITKTFLEGKREYHVHPFRFYFICLILFFGLLSIISKDFKLLELHLEENVWKYELYQKFDTISSNYIQDCEPLVFDTIKSQLYKGTKDLDRDTFFKINLFNSDLSKYGISTLDAYSLKKEEIFDKYQIENKLDRYLLTQCKRVIGDPESVIRFAIANMIWGLILLTIFMALILKILYIRHESYYVEHLLHISNYHCLNLILFSLVMIVYLIGYKSIAGIAILITLVGGIVYLITALNTYYGEKIIVTLGKTFILALFYWLAIALIIFLIVFLSLAIY